MNPNLQEIVEIAAHAGEILLQGYGKAHLVRHKGAIDLVTEVDQASEKYILNEIHARFPGDRVVAEESGILEGDADHTWFIDPLDGTVNYAHGIPAFSVSIAYAIGGKITHGVVFDPTRGEMFTAEAGKGAALNGEPLHGSTITDLDHALLATGFPYDIRTNPENNLENYSRFARLTQGVRRFGSAALDLCYVAAGRFDAYWELRLFPWDVAAGGLIVTESGGTLTDLSGNPIDVTSRPSIVAGNRQIHHAVLQVLQETNKSSIIK
jgi:myo-inositol-1(or 4)-monophosphatase